MYLAPPSPWHAMDGNVASALGPDGLGSAPLPLRFVSFDFIQCGVWWVAPIPSLSHSQQQFCNKIKRQAVPPGHHPLFLSFFLHSVSFSPFFSRFYRVVLCAVDLRFFLLHARFFNFLFKTLNENKSFQIVFRYST
jgi:hypothetical protein